MKWTIRYPAAFFTTFAIGTIVTFFITVQMAKLAEFVQPSVADLEVESLPIAKVDFSEPPVFNPNINYPNRLNVKLLQTGAFHSEEVPYKSGERWLGLFRDGNSYALRWTTIENHRIDDELFEREITTSTSQSSVFLLRDAINLKPGPIDTVFDSERGEEFNLVDGWSFGLRGQFWKLWIENADSNGYPQKGSLLMLDRNGVGPQVLRSIPDGCNDCSWKVLWVGDLDQDSNLDFLIDVSWHYNSYQPTLFLSSSGSEVGYVGIFAAFHRIGC